MIASLVLIASLPTKKLPYHYIAEFVESCSCKDICVTEITGKDAGCHGIGAIRFKSGSYGKADLGGTSAAFVWDSGKWITLTVDATESKRAGVRDLMRTFLADWGKLEPTRLGKVQISRSGKDFSLLVDGGKTAVMKMRPIFGGDQMSPVTHSNLSSPIHKVLMQGETISASVGSDHPFNLTSTNGFYNMSVRMSGRI